MALLPLVAKSGTGLSKTCVSLQFLRKMPCVLSRRYTPVLCYTNTALIADVSSTGMQSPSILGAYSRRKSYNTMHLHKMIPLAKFSLGLVTHHEQLSKKDEISTNLVACPSRAIHTSSCHQAKIPPVKLPAANFLKVHRENLKSAPMPALILGFSGLIPFVLPALYSVATMSCSCNVAYGQMAYGATILSFLGGIRWGLTLTGIDDAKPNWVNLGYSITPSLIAWLGLLMPLQPSIICVTSGLLLAAVVDSRLKGYPTWFKSLRFYLSTFAIISLLVTYVYSVLFPTDEPESGYNWYKLVKIVQIILED